MAKGKDCPRHSGIENEQRREPFDKVMAELPDNQSGKGRHKCPYCAYQQGFNQGRIAAMGPFRRAFEGAIGWLRDWSSRVRRNGSGEPKYG